MSRPAKVWVVRYQLRKAQMFAVYLTAPEATVKVAALNAMHTDAQVTDVEVWTCRIESYAASNRGGGWF